jgi:sugar/nucleoside kinase (ribokinase family)
MPIAKKLDLVTVGHFAIDDISLPNMASSRTTLGGPPTYVSVTASKLGAKAGVISKVGDDFPRKYREWLQDNGVDLSGLKQAGGSLTTRFFLEYSANYERTLQRTARAPRIVINDIRFTMKPKIIHVAPISRELSMNVMTRLRQSAPTLSLDPQGSVRTFGTRGKVRLRRWTPISILEQIDIFKSSMEEMQMVAGTSDVKQGARKIQDYGVKLVIVTHGLRGSTLLHEGAFHKIPSCKPQAVVDPTGAGDSYIGGFLAEFIKGEDSLWCACVGSASASFVVEGIGPERFGEKHETYERARQIYRKDL